MKILVLAPQPFFQERGTPIAVRLAVATLAKKFSALRSPDAAIDLLAYGEGEDITIPGVRIMRIKTPSSLKGIRPGISIKKLLCDAIMTYEALRLVIRARSNQYNVIHAVEESVFIAWLIKKVFKIPYVYDMDSSLALQLSEKWWWCKPILGLLQYFEGVAIRGSVSVAPVCDALQAIAVQHGSNSTVMLRDISFIEERHDSSENRASVFGPAVPEQSRVILYVGNLESYQGIDLLLEAFALVAPQEPTARLVIVGGTSATIEKYRSKAVRLGCTEQVIFAGPRPLRELGTLLRSADVLVSPRIKGNNTPMKIYSYLHSGTALLATDLPTHQQVLNNSISVLAAPSPVPFGEAMLTLLRDETLRARIGTQARNTADQLYTVEAFEAQIGRLYDGVESRLHSHSVDKNQRVHNE